MELSKGYFKANSILESVIALSIISICLYIAVIVFSQVFSPRTSAKYYASQNRVGELFFLFEIRHDSIMSETFSNAMKVEQVDLNNVLREISIEYTDTTENVYKRYFYVQKE